MSDPILGMIMLWPGNWVPYGWALCDGTQMPIQQNSALYSLLGTLYGGNGTTNFNLPNLNGKVVVGTPTATGVNQPGGATTASVNATGVGAVTIGVNNLPAHTHTGTFSPSGSGSTVSIAIPAVTGATGTTNIPGTGVTLANAATDGGEGANIYATGGTATTLKPFNVAVPGGGGTVTNSNTGGGQALQIPVAVPVTVSTMQPYIKLNYVIATQGIYPQRE
jgi:microcystin-dependent protein